jgi:hypothetical protein
VQIIINQPGLELYSINPIELTIYSKNQLKLLLVFYKSTLPLSITPAAMLAALNRFNLGVFGFALMTAGTVLTLLYKEISKKQEYYFYYNKSISKHALMLSCALGNLVVGSIFIILPVYA